MRETGGVFFVVAVALTEKSYTVSGLTLGTTYDFMIEA
jgi:hypothetical protein